MTSIKHKLRLSLVAIIFIIAPIINEGRVLGAVEIASFKDFSDRDVEVVRKTCDRLASTFESIKIQEQTAGLLRTSQIQTDKLRAQEEEMRQHLKEMAATQEDKRT
ncbi:MAG: hypothetical protein MI975_03570 [Cytophagales bacterium]|nr:hypothetical protein [Cytophagales bacterium]